MNDQDPTYTYDDLDGRTVFQVIRREGKRFVQRRPLGDGWAWDLEGVERVPYRWRQLEDAKGKGAVALIVEGEKDADALAARGFLATTSAGGAAWTWPLGWAQHFAGIRHVCVIADNDEPGRKAAHQRAGVLSGTVPDVAIIDALPGVGEHGDVSDWLDAGGTDAELEAIVSGAPIFVPEPETPTSGLAVRWIHETIHTPPAEPVEIIEDLLRAGDLLVIVAARKYAKSWLSMQMAVDVATGSGKFLDRLAVRSSARVLICQGELDPWGSWSRWRHLVGTSPPDGIAETFDRWRIQIEKIRSTVIDTETGMTWTREHHEARLDVRLRETIERDGIGLLIVDPWAVFYAGSENSNDEVEAALGRLRELSLATGVAIVIVHHISKVGEVREPEDLWRGASRLADWASTGVTMLPHYPTPDAWKRAGYTRQEAKRYVDLHFMRRGTPTDDFSARWDPTSGRWAAWEPTDEPDATSWASLGNIAEICAASGGSWASKAEATAALGMKRGTAVEKLLDLAVRQGLLEPYHGGPGRATGYRLPGGLFEGDVPDDDDDEPREVF